MDGSQFDAFSRAVGQIRSRRALVRLVGTLAVGGLLTRREVPVAAKRRHKRKKKRSPSGTLPPAAPPPSPPCVRDCTNKACGDDGCGGVCGICSASICNTPVCTIDAQCVTFPLPNGSACGGPCQECQNGFCGYKANGSSCTQPRGGGGVCDAFGACLPCSAERPCASGCCDGGRCVAACPSCQSCQGGICANADGMACGTYAGGTVRCCGGTCPAPTCRPAGTPCTDGEDFSQCIAACCSQHPGCAGPGCVCQILSPATNCSCMPNSPGQPCASDADCRQDFGAEECHCGTCCAVRGTGVASGQCNRCCSGACQPGTLTCA